MARYYDIAPHGLTGATGGGLTVTASSSYASYEVYRVFSLGTGTGFYWVSASGSSLPQWVKVQFDSAQELTKVGLRSNSMTEPNRQPEDFTIEGSNNDSDWDTLLTVTGETAWGNAELRDFTLTTTGEYTYYRINISDNNGDSLVSIADIFLYKTGGVVSWDNVSSDHTLTNEDRTITGAGSAGSWVYSDSNNGQVREGKYQWEIEIDTDLASKISVGINGAEGDNTGIPGDTTTGAFFSNDGTKGATTWTNALTGSFTYTTGDILTFKLDMDAGKLWIEKNGTLVQTGDIAAGTGAVVTGITDWCQPFVATNDSGAVVTGQFTEAQLTESLESGYAALGHPGEITSTLELTAPEATFDGTMVEILTGEISLSAPSATITATGVRHTVGTSLSLTAPPATIEAYSGGFMSLQAPQATFDGQAVVHKHAVIDLQAPSATFDGTAEIPIVGQLSLTAPLASFDAESITHISGDISLVAPSATFTADARKIDASLVLTVPPATIDAIAEITKAYGFLEYSRRQAR